MEKPPNKSLKKIIKAVQAAVSFQNLPFSPRGHNRADAVAARPKAHHHNKGFSGPIVSMIPAEARSRKPNSFDTQEPTSPKISCMGQIKHSNKASSKKKLKPDKFGPEGPNKNRSGIKKIFGAGRKTDEFDRRAGPSVDGLGPGLSRMRKFASSRDALANFDWTTAQIAPEEEEDRGCYSDGENGSCSDVEDDVTVPYSAPMVVGGLAGLELEPRKEVNLWKRRSMAKPKPIQLNVDK